MLDFPQNNKIHIHTFGHLQVFLDGQATDQFVTRKAEALFIYLALNPGLQSRELLADLLWDDLPQKRALANLRVLINNLRNAVPDTVETNRQAVGILPTADIWIDCLALNDAVAKYRGQKEEVNTAETIGIILKNYQAPFLTGFYLRSAPRFEAWLTTEQERWEQVIIKAFEIMVRVHTKQQAFTAAVAASQRLVQLDPLRESSQRQLLRLLVRQGESNLALQKYHQLVDLLEAELGVPPAPETTRLYERIKQAKRQQPRTLPRPFTPLIGRHQLLFDIENRLNEPACRLVTLFGMGGMGKTRLALEIAQRRTADYLSGVVFVPLATADSESAIVFALADALGLVIDSKTRPKDQLLRFLKKQEMLVILDNFEQLVDVGSDLVQEIISQTADIQLLVTSRERLFLQAEWICPVPSLQLRPSDHSQPTEATELLLSRTRQVAPEALSDKGLFNGAAHDICELVDGVPLAIELAASSFIRFSPHQVLQKIQHNLDVLESKMRDLPPRHRSMRAVFTHSWGLLSSHEQAIFQSLAIFFSGFTAASAHKICGAKRFELEALVAKSLIQKQEDGRYTMHELVRQFALEQLEAEQTAHEKVYQAFQSYFVTFLVEAMEQQNLDQIVAENGNIQQTWRLLIDHGKEEALGQMTDAWRSYHYVRSLFHAGLDQFDYAGNHLDQIESLPVRADLLASQALFLAEIGAFAQCIERSQYLIHISAESPPTTGLAVAYLCHGFALWSTGEYDEGRQELNDALIIAREYDLFWVEAQALTVLGNIALDNGRAAEARQIYSEAYDIAKREGSLRLSAALPLNLGNTFWHIGEYDEATRYFEEALDQARHWGVRQIEGLALTNLGIVKSEQNRFDTARDYLNQALQISRAIGDRKGEGNVLLNLLAVETECYHLNNAHEMGLEALQICADIGDRQGEAIVQEQLGSVYLLAGDLTTAEQYIDQAKALYQELSDPWGLATIKVPESIFLLCKGKIRAAIACGQTGITQATQIEDIVTEGKIHQLLGNAYSEQEQWSTAASHYKKAAELRRSAGQPHVVIECEVGLIRAQLIGGKRPSKKAVKRITSQLLEETIYGVLDPLRLFSDWEAVLVALGDPKSAEVSEHKQSFIAKHRLTRDVRYEI